MTTLTQDPPQETFNTRPSHSSLAGFHEPVRAWFTASFEEPTRAQQLAWPVIQAGESTLVLAPTGSGKTLAAFLAAIDHLMFPIPALSRGESPAAGCQVLYISPLKALAVDVERNLRSPIVGVGRYAERMGVSVHEPTVAIRTGDTPSRDRAQFARHPSDILITTPESLYLILTSKAREALRTVRWVIIDEIHALASTKRGAHLSLSLERLQELTGRPFQRIGLSATVRPLEEVARFLGGFEEAGQHPLARVEQANEPQSAEEDTLGSGLKSIFGDDTDEFLIPNTEHPTPDTPNAGESPALLDSPIIHSSLSIVHSVTPRPIHLVNAGSAKQLDLLVEVPVEDMAKLGQVQEIPSGPASQGETRTSIWPAIHPLILDLIKQHHSTLIFVNSRRLAERLAAALNELAGEEIVHAHHGSIAREQRMQIENELKSGKLPAMVATSSLELGIDMGAIDLVIQVEAPPSVASGIQRIGRAGHQVGAASKGIIIPKFRGDLLACAALTDRMSEGAVESMRYLRNPLDILAQQIVALVSMDDWRVDDLERVVRRSAPFAEIPQSLFGEVLDMLSGRYPSDDFAELRPRITWDRLNGTLHAREGAKRIAITNGGTIPDRGLYGVFLLGAEKGAGRVGELDEEMVFESKVGDTFLLGASSWRIEEITHDRVVVSPAPGMPGKMPYWHGESVGRPLEFGRAIGALTRKLRGLSDVEGMALLTGSHSLNEASARNLLQYLQDQVEAAGAAPDDRTLIVESYRDDMGDWRVCILSPFGGKVHAPWAMAIAAMVRERTDFEIDVIWTDDGIVARFPESDEPPPVDAMLPDPDEVNDLVVRQLGSGGGGARGAGNGAPVIALFASRFREAASRALLLPRRHPGQRAPLWQQRKRAAELLQATAKFGSFPMVLETYRECLRDVFDMPALVGLLREIRSRDIRVVSIESRSPSPFAAALMFNYAANFIYEGDAPLAERRAQALTVDPTQLRELLGEVELRELLDADALEELELYLQHLSPGRQVKHADGLHDLLIRLGDLTAEEIGIRCASPQEAPLWIERLERDRRVITLPMAGERRYIAVEDAGRYRDALGIPPPPGLPDAFLDYVRDPLGDLVTRYARTHGPFTAVQLAHRYAVGVGPVTAALQKLEEGRRVVQGEFRPGGSGTEWCESGVLRALRQKSLARLRQEVEPVDASALGRLYLGWQRIKMAPTPENDLLPTATRAGHLVASGNGSMQFEESASAHETVRSHSRRDNTNLIDIIEQLQGAAIPASVLEKEALPARHPSYDPRELDLLTSSGAVLWVGREPLGQHDGRISLYLAEHAALLLGTPAVGGRGSGGADGGVDGWKGGGGGERTNERAGEWENGGTGEWKYGPVEVEPTSEATLTDKIRAHLFRRGASFFPQILTAVGGFAPEALEALWDLVWAGEVTNDTMQPLRAFLRTRSKNQSSPPSAGRNRTPQRWRAAPRSGYGAAAPVPPEASGRWSLVSSLVYGEPTPTERLSAQAHQLLDRYGVLTREAVGAEGIEGGFSAIYGVLKALEEAGRVRRGYFVAGMGATQFAVPGAVDRLRTLRDPAEEIESVLLAATDPANPYGAALGWPDRPEGRRPMRMAGASVILVDGILAAWIPRGERQILTFIEEVVEQSPDRTPQEVAYEIARVVGLQVRVGGRRALLIEEVDGQPPQDTPLAGALLEAGFSHGGKGYLKRV